MILLYSFPVPLPTCSSPPAQLSKILLRAENEWQLDSFELEGLCNGRPLSCLAFHLFKRVGLVSHFRLNETKLARQVPAARYIV